MLKAFAKKIVRKAGLEPASINRIGINFTADINRLAGDHPINLILDVGANEGQSALRFLSDFPAARIHCFEPVPSTFGLLESHTKSNPRVQRHPYALGQTPGTVQINLHDSSGSNSIKANQVAGRTVNIDVKRLDNVLTQLKTGKVDLLKIDVEGFELEVLVGAGQSLAEGRCRFIYAECVLEPNPDTSHTPYASLRDFLKPMGFTTFCYYPESFNLSTGSAMGNVLFAYKYSLPSRVAGAVRNIY